jgi:hypothetical protein
MAMFAEAERKRDEEMTCDLCLLLSWLELQSKPLYLECTGLGDEKSE